MQHPFFCHNHSDLGLRTTYPKPSLFSCILDCPFLALPISDKLSSCWLFPWHSSSQLEGCLLNQSLGPHSSGYFSTSPNFFGSKYTNRVCLSAARHPPPSDYSWSSTSQQIPTLWMPNIYPEISQIGEESEHKTNACKTLSTSVVQTGQHQSSVTCFVARASIVGRRPSHALQRNFRTFGWRFSPHSLLHASLNHAAPSAILFCD